MSLCPRAGFSQDAGALLEEKYTLEIAPGPLVEILGVMRAEMGVRFVYSPSNLPVDQLVAVSAYENSMREILDATFVPLHISYEIIGGQVALRWNPPEKRVEYTQTIRGRVIDQDTRSPLIGAHVIVDSMSPIQGASTDIDGYFEIVRLPVGRHSLSVQYIGYEPLQLPELLLTAGKELVLDVKMVSMPITIAPIEVAGTLDPLLPLNEAATVSARSFSVEQTQRYAASLSDPARMAQVFAGVSRSEDDLRNDVTVRGQSPKYTIWMLEGVEIPNPNHFGEEGFSSGGVNMLSANMLTYSDFLSGAFPASYGNALAGIFDVNLRKGNNVRAEHTIHVGVLGLEATTEGPFSRSYNGSYVVNYRYSTAGLLSKAKLLQEDVVGYEDLSFKVHLPTRKAGQFDLFGVFGASRNENFAARDSTAWGLDQFGIDDGIYEKRGIVGLSHTAILNDKAFVKSTAVGFVETEDEEFHAVDPAAGYVRIGVDEEESVEGGVRGISSLNWKVSPRNVLQVGIGASYLRFRYLFREKRGAIDAPWFYTINSESHAITWKSYVQWLHRPNTRLHLQAGIHVAGFSLNNETTVEPRVGLRWEIHDGRFLSIGTGLYSQIEPYGTYIVERIENGNVIQPNRSLQKAKSWHNVVGYEHHFTPVSRLKVELYYNLGYDTPVGNIPGNTFSVVNSYYLYDVVIHTEGLANEGTTVNYGVDLTLERFFSDGFYALLTGSLFDASYSTIDGAQFSSRYDTGYIVNLLGGIEKPFGDQKKNLVSVNGRIVFGGGNKYTPIDIDASQETGFEILQNSARFSSQLEPYFRVDLGFNFTFNKPYVTHTVYFDAQNILNQRNLADPFFDRVTDRVRVTHQTGILPVLGYKLTF